MAKGLQHMVDFNVELVRLSQRAPSVENGVCDFEDTDVDLGVGGRKTADEILETVSGAMRARRAEAAVPV